MSCCWCVGDWWSLPGHLLVVIIPFILSFPLPCLSFVIVAIVAAATRCWAVFTLKAPAAEVHQPACLCTHIH